MLITSLTTTTRGLLNISALHVQYGIQAFGKFKRPEYTRLHLRKLQISQSSDALYRAHIALCILHLYRPPLSQNSASAPGFKTLKEEGLCQNKVKYYSLV